MSEIEAVSVISITSRSRVDAVVVEAALDMREHRGVGDRQGGHVDRDPRAAVIRAVAGAMPAEQRGDMGQHEPVDVADQAVALGRGQEPAGSDEPSRGFVGEAHERLVVRGAPVAEGDDRLVVHGEQVLLAARGAGAQATDGGADPRARRPPP